MSSVNIFKIKSELKSYGVPFLDSEPISSLRAKFDALPITEGQIEQLYRLKIRYASEWNWSRGFASGFINKCDEYYKLRNNLPISPEQRILLMNKGIDFSENLTSGEAARLIYNLPPDTEQLLYIEKYGLKVNKLIPLTFGYCQYIIGKRESFIKLSRMNSVGK